MTNPSFPGVFLEELTSGARPIAGVPTATTGFAGLLACGPVRYPGGPTTDSAPLVTSAQEFARTFGDMAWLDLASSTEHRPPYVAHAAHAFFTNGGARLHVARVFAPRMVHGVADWGVASAPLSVLGHTIAWRARWPGRAGNVAVETTVQRSHDVANVSVAFGGIVQAAGATHGTIVEVITPGRKRVAPPVGNAPLTLTTLAEVTVDAKSGRQYFRRRGRAFRPKPTDVIQIVTARVTVQRDGVVIEQFDGLGAHANGSRYVAHVLPLENSADSSATLWFDVAALDAAAGAGGNVMTAGSPTRGDVATHLLVALQHAGVVQLCGGHDGAMPTPAELAGQSRDSTDEASRATGLHLLDDCDDIGIVALPDAATYPDDVSQRAATQLLIDHVARHPYRFAVVDGPPHASTSDIRAFRAAFDSSRAALYHPWVETVDPSTQQPLLIPPSGAVCGVYARVDITRGVHVAPANEELRGITALATAISAAEQGVLNPEGINALRSLTGRGLRVWGARTMSANPEWKYVNVRRFISFLERSIDVGTQWVVFEPNDEPLWAKVGSMVQAFLYDVWRSGALLGSTPRESFFVRCDRSTMTQTDLDNGRLIVLVGVAPLRPAEFMIFRIGQWTARA